MHDLKFCLCNLFMKFEKYIRAPCSAYKTTKQAITLSGLTMTPFYQYMVIELGRKMQHNHLSLRYLLPYSWSKSCAIIHTNYSTASFKRNWSKFQSTFNLQLQFQRATKNEFEIITSIKNAQNRGKIKFKAEPTNSENFKDTAQKSFMNELKKN